MPRLLAAFGLHYWEISVGYDPALGSEEDGVTRGECSRLVDYQSAHICLNPEAFECEKSVLLTLRHELFHIVLSPFDLYTSAVERLEMPDQAVELLERIRDHAIERAVAALERMHCGLTGN